MAGICRKMQEIAGSTLFCRVSLVVSYGDWLSNSTDFPCFPPNPTNWSAQIAAINVKNIKRKRSLPVLPLRSFSTPVFFCLLAAAIQPSRLIILNPHLGGLSFHCRPVDLFLPMTSPEFFPSTFIKHSASNRKTLRLILVWHQKC